MSWGFDLSDAKARSEVKCNFDVISELEKCPCWMKELMVFYFSLSLCASMILITGKHVPLLWLNTKQMSLFVFATEDKYVRLTLLKGIIHSKIKMLLWCFYNFFWSWASLVSLDVWAKLGFHGWMNCFFVKTSVLQETLVMLRTDAGIQKIQKTQGFVIFTDADDRHGNQR